jgi:hypothetical protein
MKAHDVKAKAWMKKNLDGNPEGWPHLVLEGYADLDALEDCQFKTDLIEWRRLSRAIEDKLDELGHEPG